VDEVLFEQRDHVAWITINRPAARNIMNAAVFVGLADAWQRVREDGSIRAAVLTASGEQDFCCGGDLGEIIPLWTGARQPANALEERLLADPGLLDRVMMKNEPLCKPVIAAVNGRALGGGCEILLGCDIRIAADNASFGLPEPKSGVVPGAGSMVRLARQIPYAHAMRMMLTAEPVDAGTALQYGLVSEVVPAAQLLVHAERVAAQVVANAPLALAAIKRTVLESHTLGWDEAFRVEMREAGAVMASADAREGPRAFREKRKPVFHGR
jgi:enoyl-CoA hydratase